MEAIALVDALKRVLKSRGLTYAEIAKGLGLSEASVKRIFSRRDFTLERIDEICRIAGVDFADLARSASEERPGADRLTAEQEAELVSDPKLLLVALCAVNNWTFDEIVATYDLTRAECTRLLLRLDRHRIVELAPGNRIRPLISRTFSWRPGGPIQRFFHERIQAEYLASAFDRPDELLLFASGMLSHASSAELVARLRRVARDFAEQHRDDLRLPLAQRFGTSLLVAMRPWEPRAFRKLRRPGAEDEHGARLLQLQQAGPGRASRSRTA
ncbi:MAG TPA: helix-turn-helix transcriptional regulator [Casimicrobiaceae bacterium]|nr:helix-turn-helix transcriptional regulator [Casimicrobiaceae bacterium]